MTSRSSRRLDDITAEMPRPQRLRIWLDIIEEINPGGAVTTGSDKHRDRLLELIRCLPRPHKDDWHLRCCDLIAVYAIAEYCLPMLSWSVVSQCQALAMADLLRWVTETHGPSELRQALAQTAEAPEEEAPARACCRGARVLPQVPLAFAPQVLAEAEAVELSNGGVWLAESPSGGRRWNREQMEELGLGCNREVRPTGCGRDTGAWPTIDPSSPSFWRSYEALRQLILVAASLSPSSVTRYPWRRTLLAPNRALTMRSSSPM